MTGQVSPADRPPRIVIVAGPNGAGKSTVAEELLQGTLAVDEFVNADTIAQGLSWFRPQEQAVAAGRAMVARLRKLASSRKDFGFETTLAARRYARWLQTLHGKGYVSCVAFLWLPSPEASVTRVRSRVQAGGHDVPEDVIRRRFSRGLRNFFRLYRPAATTWRFYDNSAASGPRLIARGGAAGQEWVGDAGLWDRLRAEYDRE
jgi:predicted ABC-type ATPase